MFPRCLSTSMRQALQDHWCPNSFHFSRPHKLTFSGPWCSPSIALIQVRMRSKGQSWCEERRGRRMQGLCWPLLPLSPRILAIGQWVAGRETAAHAAQEQGDSIEKGGFSSDVSSFPRHNVNLLMHGEVFQVAFHRTAQQSCYSLMCFIFLQVLYFTFLHCLL